MCCGDPDDCAETDCGELRIVDEFHLHEQWQLDALAEYLDDASEHKPFVHLTTSMYRRWYQFGWRSPVVLVKRIRSRYQVTFRLRMAWQRARRGYADDQLWSLNFAVAQLTVAGVSKMREWRNGYPSECGSFERWESILIRIEEGFQAFIDEDGWFYGKPEAERKFKEGLALFSVWFGALWD